MRKPEDYNFDKLQFEVQWLTKHYSPISGPTDKRFVVIHHMTIPGNGNGNALDRCYETWQNREASAHYGVDKKRVRQYVKDKDFAWATGSNYGNLYGISIEQSNSVLGPRWLIDPVTIDTTARLTASLHHNYKMGRPVSMKTVFPHGHFVGTECPGPYMRSDSVWNKFIALCQKYYDNPGDDDMFSDEDRKKLERLERMVDPLFYAYRPGKKGVNNDGEVAGWLRRILRSVEKDLSVDDIVDALLAKMPSGDPKDLETTKQAIREVLTEGVGS